MSAGRSSQEGWVGPFLALHVLHLLEGHWRLALWIQILEVKGLGGVSLCVSVARHDQVVRLVDVLSMSLHRTGSSSSCTFKGILLGYVGVCVVLGTGFVGLGSLADLHLEVEFLGVWAILNSSVDVL